MIGRHYTREEWIAFKKGSMPQAAQPSMEEHLRLCDRCLATYLSCIEERDVELAEVFLPADFATMTAQKAASPDFSPWGQRTIALRNYAVAAIFTAALLSGGWFAAISRDIPSTLLEPSAVKEIVEERPSHWRPRELVRKIVEWIDATIR